MFSFSFVLIITLFKHGILFYLSRLSRENFENLAKTIVEVFPTEKEITYYKRYQDGQYASGKLWFAYNNLKSELAATGVIERKKHANTPKLRLNLGLKICFLAHAYIYIRVDKTIF